MKLKEKRRSDGSLIGYGIKCPGCDGYHLFFMSGDMTWEFNGNLEKPTFRPSLKNSHDGNKYEPPFCCHLNLTDGVLQFHPDCTHANKGKFMDLPDYPEYAS